MVHCDIKPENILIESNENLNVVLTDLELIQPTDKPVTNFEFGSLFYRAPEILEKKAAKFSPSLDMWGFGVTFAELVCGIPRLFPGKSDIEVGILVQMFGHNRQTYIKQKTAKTLTAPEVNFLRFF